jgi:Family of unknown function (DUF6516)
MSTTVRDYLDEVERLFLLSPVVHSFQIREREARLHEGFIRIRAVLTNGDVLEAFEFVVVTPDAVQTRTYRLHWQQGDGRLKRRRDNAPHHRDVLTFPHHVHVGPIDQVESATPMTIRQALAYIEETLQRDDSLSQG